MSIYAEHPTRGTAKFTDRAWELLGESKGGWVKVEAEPSPEVSQKLKAAKPAPAAKKPAASGAKPITAKPPANAVQVAAPKEPSETGDGDAGGI